VRRLRAVVRALLDEEEEEEEEEEQPAGPEGQEREVGGPPLDLAARRQRVVELLEELVFLLVN